MLTRRSRCCGRTMPITQKGIVVQRARKVLGLLLGAAFVLCVAAMIVRQFSGVIHTPPPSAADNIRMALLSAVLLAGMVFCLTKVD
jgi:hypothetical protein